MKQILVTGNAGFIGYHLSKRLIKESFEVFGLDNINNYYDVKLKFSRLEQLGVKKKNIISEKIIKSECFDNFKFIKTDLANYKTIVKIIKDEKFDCVINLAAQAGVRYSITNPQKYTHSNIDGFLSILEGCRYATVKHLIYASTSSVYGLNKKMPLNETMPSEHPMALYAATKKANEMMAHSYSHLFNLPTTGLRFFTVYGPWGRPDMALFLFTEAIMNNKPINVFNYGNMIRDFTYVDDIVESVTRLISKPPKINKNWNASKPLIDTSSAPYKIFNIGNGKPVKLMRYIRAIENELGIKAKYNMMSIQPGDVAQTHADTTSLENYINFKPNTSVEHGIASFIKWYKKFYKKIK